MHMIQIKAIADANGPDITGAVVPMPAGSVHLAPASLRPWYEQRADVFEILTDSGTEYFPMVGVMDASGNVTGLVGPDGAFPVKKVGLTGKVFTPTYTLQKWNLAVRKALQRKRPARLLFVGDSTTAGMGGGTTKVAQCYNDNAFRSGVPSQVAALLHHGLLKTTSDTLIGTSRCSITPAPTSYPSYDPRVVFGGAWGLTESTSFLGGGFFSTTTNVGQMDFYPAEPFDNFTVYYAISPVGGTALQVLVDDSATGYSTINNNGANALGIANYTVPGDGLTASAPNKHKISFIGSETGTSWIAGIVCWNSKEPGIIVAASGASGIKAANAASDTSFNSLVGLRAFAPDLTVINLSINDQGVTTSGAQQTAYLASITAIATAALVSGDVLILINSPNTNSGFADADLYYSNILSYAEENSINLYDLRYILGSTYAIAAAAGYMDDSAVAGVHLSAMGYSAIANSLIYSLVA